VNPNGLNRFARPRFLCSSTIVFTPSFAMRRIARNTLNFQIDTPAACNGFTTRSPTFVVIRSATAPQYRWSANAFSVSAARAVSFSRATRR